MAQTPTNGPRRGSDGRFVKRRSSTSSKKATSHLATSAKRPGAGPLALLTPAILLGLIGFVIPVCWVGSLVLMGVLWGSVAIQRQQLNGGRGVLSEVVDVVVDEAKDVAESASRSIHPQSES